MYRGFIKLWRKVQDHELWNEPRELSRFEAWLDILLKVNHSNEPKKVLIGNKTYVCRRGECLYSMGTWAERWRWDKSKVKRFLKLLEAREMIVLKSNAKTTHLRLVNYSIYNDTQHASDTQVTRRRHTGDTQVTPTKELKNGSHGSNVSNEELLASIANDMPEKFYTSRKEKDDVVMLVNKHAVLAGGIPKNDEIQKQLFTKVRNALRKYGYRNVDYSITKCSPRATDGDGWGLILTELRSIKHPKQERGGIGVEIVQEASA